MRKNLEKEKTDANKNKVVISIDGKEEMAAASSDASTSASGAVSAVVPSAQM